MKFKKYIFAINSYDQAVNTIKICYNWKILPIIYIKYFMVNGLGPDWVEEFNNLLKKQFSVKKFKLCVDCKNNYGLFINLVEQKIDYLKVDVEKETFVRLKQIAKKNKVLLNPHFSVLDLSKLKNIKLKIKKIFKNDS